MSEDSNYSVSDSSDDDYARTGVAQLHHAPAHPKRLRTDATFHDNPSNSKVRKKMKAETDPCVPLEEELHKLGKQLHGIKLSNRTKEDKQKFFEKAQELKDTECDVDRFCCSIGN